MISETFAASPPVSATVVLPAALWSLTDDREVFFGACFFSPVEGDFCLNPIFETEESVVDFFSECACWAFTLLDMPILSSK
jgi:hypothetical protein